MDSSQPQPEINEPERLPFDVEFFKRSEDFCASIMASLPELSGIAIVPLWTNPPENLPAGLVRLRKQTPPYIGSLLALLSRLSSLSADAHKDLLQQLKVLGQYSVQLTEEIEAKAAELNRFAESPETPADAEQTQ